MDVRPLLASIFVLVACTDDGPSSGGPDVTSHVESFDIEASAPGACLTNEPLDADAATAGTQIDCSVSNILNYGMTDAVETVLPRCNNETSSSSTNKPCWALALDAVACTSGSHYIIKVEREQAPPSTTHVIVQCVTQ